MGYCSNGGSNEWLRPAQCSVHGSGPQRNVSHDCLRSTSFGAHPEPVGWRRRFGFPAVKSRRGPRGGGSSNLGGVSSTGRFIGVVSSKTQALRGIRGLSRPVGSGSGSPAGGSGFGADGWDCRPLEFIASGHWLDGFSRHDGLLGYPNRWVAAPHASIRPDSIPHPRTPALHICYSSNDIRPD